MNPNSTDNESRIARVAALLSYRRDHVALGELSDVELGNLVRERELVRVIRGAYMRRADWDGLFPEEKLLARTLAAVRMTQQPAAWVVSHHSAAALWGLPLFGLADLRVHAGSLTETPKRSSRSVAHHRLDVSGDDVISLFGIQVTSLERTIIDLAHSAPAELAIGAVDAGLALLLGGGRGQRAGAVAEWRAKRLAELQRSWRPGVRSARTVLGLADPRAESPAESLSRLQLHRLRVPYEIQVPVRLPRARTAWMDFELLGADAFGEVDGSVKYTDASYRDGRSAEEVVLAEKRREDEVRGISGNRVVRWEPRHALQARTLGLRLRRFGIRVPGLER